MVAVVVSVALAVVVVEVVDADILGRVDRFHTTVAEVVLVAAAAAVVVAGEPVDNDILVSYLKDIGKAVLSSVGEFDTSVEDVNWRRTGEVAKNR